MNRRNLLKGLSLGASSILLTPALTRWVSEAHGETGALKKNLILLTDGNGWFHQQSQSRNSTSLDTAVRSPTDWDLPQGLASWQPWKSKVTVCRPFYNPHGRNLHGNGWSTLTVTPKQEGGPSGISLDRMVAKAIGKEDLFDSVAMAVSVRPGKTPVCMSADGPGKSFPAFGSPLEAHSALFAGATPQSQKLFEQDQGLLDLMIQDAKRVRMGLGGPERAKLDQLLDSYQDMEKRFKARKALADVPSAPDAEIKNTLQRQTIEAYVDLAAHALAFGLTHVVHLSMLGRDAHNPGWGFLDVPGDAHEHLSHVSNGYDRTSATQAVHKIIDFKARMMARLYQKLSELPAGNGSLADHTLIVWINSGGGKHHNGSDHHPVVMLGDAGGAIRAGQYLELPFKTHCISDAFVSIAQAMGLKDESFGDPSRCKGPMSELLV